MEIKVSVNDTKDVLKVYKEKPYLNSNGDPFGLTINGKNKEYVHAHELIKGFLKKGKEFSKASGKIKILDASHNKACVNAVVEVSSKDGTKGHVELKVYNPSVNKKKGATMELRKMPDHDYSCVERLKNILTNILDDIIDGGDPDGLNKPEVGRVTSNPKLFTCDVCDWETKFPAALKAHKKRIHSKLQSGKTTSVNYTCDNCEYKTNDETKLKDHTESDHKKTRKRSKSTFTCEKSNCDSTFETSVKLNAHIKSQHVISNKVDSKDRSPCSSPPRKKLDKADESDEEMLDLDSSEITIEKELNKNFLLEKRIRELEILVASLLEEKNKDDEFKSKINKDIDILKNHSKPEIPKHLLGVNEQYLSELRGYSMIYKVFGDGACLTNCAAVHIYEDADEGPKLKKKVNHHIADNWDNYYKNKIVLPYREVVGVGDNAHVIEKKTSGEMIEFLRSEEALMVFSNIQEVIAIANIFNVKINVFTYEGKEGKWSDVHPDPEIRATAEQMFERHIPDMALYHSKDTHYDLLVKDDSRLAKLGLLAGIKENADEDNKWKTVNSKNKKKSNYPSPDEKLLSEENEANEKGNVFEEISEEETLLRGKKSGHRRTAPNIPAEIAPTSTTTFKCPKCIHELESKGLMDAHMKTHEDKKPIFSCESCGLEFDEKTCLKEHNKEHESKTVSDEWNCNECPFQANTADELIKHLRLTSHQPSQNIQDKKSIFPDCKQCYTCKIEFNGYWNLMNHRKSAHPSNKKCRNFPDGKCNFAENCWYVHEEELMDVDESFRSENEVDEAHFKCYACGEKFKTRDSFMKHKKDKHEGNVPNCDKFLVDKCDRREEDCWFKHKEREPKDSPPKASPQKSSQPNASPFKKQSDFCEAPKVPFPPDLLSHMMEVLNNLCSEVELMQMKMKEMMK